MQNWTKVFESAMNYQVEIVADILESHGLSPVIINKKETYTQLGVYEVMVSKDEIMRALKIIQDEIHFT